MVSPAGERKNSASVTEATISTPRVISCCTVTGAPITGTRKNESTIRGIVMIRVSLNCQNWMPIAASATPAVPTSTVTREALRSGCTTRRSVSSPIATATPRPNAIAQV